MDGFKDRLAALGVHVPDILLPAKGTDWAKWAVVACDQYSSEPDYWKRVETAVSGAPSSLNLVFPEAYLEDPDAEERIERIQERMRDYLERGVLSSAGEGLVLVERFTPYEEKPRVGLVLAVDLEAYCYDADSSSLIRPTEGTIASRLPARMRIRRGADLELPHIMLLVDDPGRSVIEPIYAGREKMHKLYDFDLMLGSGRVRGWKIDEGTILGRLAEALEAVRDAGSGLLFAVGDGNHSLATAKAIWEETKAANPSDPGIMDHPARFALAELVNVYDEGLPFHPIHRLLSGVDEDELLAALKSRRDVEVKRCPSVEDAIAAVDASSEGEIALVHRVALLSRKGSSLASFKNPSAHLAAGSLQGFLDPFLGAHKGASIDYIHGSESLVALARMEGKLGLYLPPIDKSSFFATVIRDGVMPRKTFSMGEAPEKRFYIEARRITRCTR
jgi:hypothetical protein